MCGFTGIIARNTDIDLKNQLKHQCDALIQRGPDDAGYYVKNDIALGHRRLSIIDLATGHQPMYSADGKLVLVFNGEIYNFKKLREELIDQGCTFNTESDTEVLINGYQIWGIKKVLQRIEGMFAFAMYDSHTNEVFLARDRYGEKPLYYIDNENGFYFGSELKALEQHFDPKKIEKKGLNYFLSLSYIPAPFTIYQGVKKMMPSTYLKIDNKRNSTTHSYYSLKEELKDRPYYDDFAKAKLDLRLQLKESVRQRMVSDVPIGAFLSGGIDSSIIAGLMAEISPSPINTFSIGFVEKDYDESDRAQLVADKIKSNHTVHFLDYKDVVSIVDDIILYFDEPFGDSSAIPSYYVAKLAREKVTVVLTGDCADELFGGYEKYLGQYYKDKLLQWPKWTQLAIKNIVKVAPHTKWTNSFLRKAKKVLSNLELSNFDLHYNLMCLGFSDSDRKKLLKGDNWEDIKFEMNEVYNSYSSKEPLEKSFYTDLQYVLEGDMLTKVDRVCMQNSLEARVPFLDSQLVHTAYRMPLSFKIKGKNKKYILKETFKDILPEETIGFRKKGFGIPVDYWFKNELKSEMEALIDKSFLRNQGLFDGDYLHQLWEEHQSGKENHKGKLWNIFVFQKWYKKHIGEA